ncbi:MAG: hypothetical protein MI974_12725 [Chitinophagales bacterium]|nr:hypothetical protein [Chitinophagales bacterium]
MMAQLIVRNLDEQLKSRIQMQARLKGISMEEEVRRILSRSLEEKTHQSGEKIAAYFKEMKGDFYTPKMKGQGVQHPDF